MQRSQDQRINLGEQKAHIVKKIGVERSRRYFYYVGRFLSQKLTKSEFDKSCFRLLGRENLPLHNQLVRSILRNATVAKSPPSVQEAGHLTKPLGNAFQSRGDGPESLIPNHNQNDPVWSNGVLPISPRKVRSGMRDRKMRDRPSPLGSNGKVEHMLHHQPICREDNRGGFSMENGDMGQFDYQRLGRFVADERDGEFLRPVEKPRIPSKDQGASAAAMRDDENQEEQARLNPLIAPLGIPFCSASVGGSRRTIPVSTSVDLVSCYDSGGLPDTEMLRKRMENIAVAQGLGGVSMECANTLNNMLDVYLKNLIKSTIDTKGGRSTHVGDHGKQQTLEKQQSQNKIVNGVWPSNSLQIQSSNGPSDITQDQHSVSLLDFRTAMELNPHQLGENWPILREKISMRSFEEQDEV